MTYQEALDKINGRLRFGVKPGLERISSLLSLLGNPQDKLKFVHVAGTNGKGTTSTLMASVLQESGLVTGLYTSPYVLEFRERFRINGEMIPEEELIQQLEVVSRAADQLEARGEPITEFEFITALVFHWFAERGCDMVVLEVGLGGRFDATNVISTPEVAVVMSISLDHTAILGDTVEQIAFEKAGIIKEGGTVVLYPCQEPGVFHVFEDICNQRNARLIVPSLEGLVEKEKALIGTAFTFEGMELTTPFLGEHQVRNACTAFTALQVLKEKGYPISPVSLQTGFQKAYLPARMEVLGQEPLVLLDGGHNPGCAKALKEALEQFVPQRKVAVIGMLSDKDSHEALRIVGPLFSRIITVTPDSPRAKPAEELAQVAEEFCSNVTPAQTCGEALAKAFQKLQPDDALIVWGSFYLAGEIREQLAAKAAAFSKSNTMKK